jgi:GT2 family glycosyltransferase
MIERDTTVVIASSEDPAVFKCIDSVNGEAKIVVSLTPSEEIERCLVRYKIPHVVVPRGNLGITFNAGIELAETEKVIVMTDDSTFDSGAIGELSQGLNHFDACKARIIFAYNKAKPLTKLVSDVRDFINLSPTRVYTPGLAINKNIKERMGGYFFSDKVRWGEDAEFSYRFHKKGLQFGYIPQATVNHPSVSVTHDLRGAFLIGLSKRRSVELGLREGNEDYIPTIKRIISGETFQKLTKILTEKGIASMFYMIVWNVAYNYGYNLHKYGLSRQIEENMWSHFGRDKRNVQN